MERNATAPLFLLPAVLLPLLGSCGTAVLQRDLARNSELYVGTGFRARHRTELKVCLPPLVDARGPLNPFAEGKFPVIYTQGISWDRPVTLMLHELMLRELREAGLFAEIVSSARDADWVLRTTLKAFYGAVEQRMEGRLVKGLTQIRLEVHGPRMASGVREVLRVKEYTAPVTSTVGFILPSPLALAGASFARALVQMLQDLESGGRHARGESVEAAGEPPKALLDLPWMGKKKQD